MECANKPGEGNVADSFLYPLPLFLLLPSLGLPVSSYWQLQLNQLKHKDTDWFRSPLKPAAKLVSGLLVIDAQNCAVQISAVRLNLKVGK